MDKQLREQLKHDKFVEEVGHTVEYLSGHKAQVRKYGAIAGVVLVLVFGAYGFMSYQKSTRQEALRKASMALDAFVGDPAQNPNPAAAVYKTQAEKDAASLKAFQDMAAQHSGSTEGDMAQFQVATLLCDQGKGAECESAFKKSAQSGDANIAALSKLSLATMYLAQGNDAEAEKLGRELAANPTAVVSKEQGQLIVAKAIMKTKPQDARTMLEALQALDRPAVTRAAVAVLGELMNR